MEPNLLMSRTFLILGGMLVVTTLSARFNKAYETTLEAVFTIGGTFLFLIMVMIYADSYPLNLVMVAIFSGFIGWSLGPTIAYIGERFKFRKYLKSKAVLSKTVKKIQMQLLWKKCLGLMMKRNTSITMHQNLPKLLIICLMNLKN